MESLNNVLIWILEIGVTFVIIMGSLLWLRAAGQSRSTARSFMALVFTYIFFIMVILRSGDFSETTIRWMSVVYGGIMAFYISARMLEKIKGRD